MKGPEHTRNFNNSIPIEERTFHSAAAHRPASWAGYPTYIFLQGSWIFLEYTDFFFKSLWDILFPVRSEVSYFGRSYVHILKTFLLFYYWRFEGVEADEGHDKVPAIHTRFFLIITQFILTFVLLAY